MVPIITKIFRDNWDRACAESNSWQLKRPAVIKNVEKIVKCRTLWLGVKAFQCKNKKCKRVIFVPHSCKSRICPACGFKATLNWQGAFMHRVIPSEYQHLVFSVPPLLKELFSCNRRAITKLVYRVGVFQSFGKSLNLHPHFHVIRTAGGVSLKDGKSWVESSYLPEQSIKSRFKAKILKGLRGLHRQGKLRGYL